MTTSIDSFFADEGLFRLTIDASPSGMIITDRDGTIVLVNRAAQVIFGYLAEELVGQPVEVLVPECDREAHAGHRARYAECPEPRSMALGRNLCGVRKDGSEVQVDISLHPIETTRGPLVLANVMDATDRRRAEQEREARHRLERLALLGQLAGGVAHEIRTPLCVISNDIFFLRQFMNQLGPDGAECVEEIEQAVGKANRIVTELLDYTREAPVHTVETPLREIVAVALRDAALPTGVQVACPEIPEAMAMKVDRDQVQRILTNLLKNASQAMGSEGQIDVTAGRQADRFVIEVADRGPGIPAEELDRVFEPLYTTRSSGIGLGLAVSRRYAQRHGGDLTASQREGGGACFRLELPQALPSGNEDRDNESLRKQDELR